MVDIFILTEPIMRDNLIMTRQTVKVKQSLEITTIYMKELMKRILNQDMVKKHR